MRKSNLFLIVFVVLYLGSITMVSPTTYYGSNPHGGFNRPYHFRVILRQWEIIMYDMNKVQDLVDGGATQQQALAQSEYTNVLGSLIPGSQIFFKIYSTDVQHGISAHELGISVVVTSPTHDIDSGTPVLANSVLPDKEMSFFIKCNVYCGLGHSGMVIKVVVGHGQVSNGPLILRLSVFAIGMIFVIFANLMFSEFPKYILVIKDPKQKKHSHQYIIYDITKLSEKDRIMLKHNVENIENVAKKIDIVSTNSLPELKSKVEELSGTERWIIEYYDL